MTADVLLVLYVALPAFVANMAPVLATRLGILQSLATPIDRGRMWRGNPLLGKNKTWRGILAAVIGSVAVTILQYVAFPPTYAASLVYESVGAAIIFGIWVAVLVLVGDALGSVIKRQLGYESGTPCIPLDQIDYIIVFIVGTTPFIHWTAIGAVTLVGVTFFLNLGTNALAYVTRIKNTYW
jgi:CDP-2,3-bis-(O-geranylgeranyl)-sn-glycerol synthase